MRVWRWQFWLLLAVGAWATLAAVLPYAHTAPWTKNFAAVGLALPTTLSVQPAVTLQACVLVWAGLLAAIWTLGQSFPHDFLKKFLRRLVVVLGLLCAVATVCLAAGLKNPAFPDSQFFSYFANRNQSATLYALTALIAGGLVMIEKRRSRKAVAAAALLFALGALALGPSRGGWVAVAAGSVALLWGRPRAATAGIGLATLAALVVLVGIPGWEARPADLMEIRPTLFANAWTMIVQNPWGVGAGNFAYIFPQVLSAPLSDRVVLHPENDLLWMLAELGWVGVLLPVALFSLRWEHHRRARIVAALITALALTSFFDVPLHRLGLVVLMCACVGPVLRQPTGVRAPGQRVWTAAAVALLVFALLLPSPRRAKAQFDEAVSQKDAATTHAFGQKLLSLTPYDAYVYQQLGHAQLRWHNNPAAAESYFKKSFTLQPRLATFPYEAGLSWQPTDPKKALAAWREALRRTQDTGSGAPNDAQAALFYKIIRNSGLSLRQLAPLCGSDARLWALLLNEERHDNLGELLTLMNGEDFWELPHAQEIAARALLSDRPPLEYFQKLPRTPAKFRALILAQRFEYQKAAELALSTLPAPVLQDTFPSLSLEQLTLKAKILGSQAPTYLEALAARAQKAGDTQALDATLANLCRLPGASTGARTLRAQRLYQSSKWLESWQELRHILFP